MVSTEELVAAVTEPTRRRLLDVLLEHGESSPTTLAGHLPVTRQAVSKHLQVLDRAGVVEVRRDAGHTRCRLNVDRLDEATRSLSELAAAWDRRLLRIKRLAEASHARSKRQRQ